MLTSTSIMRHIFLFLFMMVVVLDHLMAQATFPVNDVDNPAADCYALINASVVNGEAKAAERATVVIRKGRIEAVGQNAIIPKDALIIDCNGKYLYPSFIDLYADYGINIMPASAQPRQSYQVVSNTRGPYGWNQAIRSEQHSYQLFNVNETRAKELRAAGFGTVLTHHMDGISRGTGVLVTLANERENQVILREKAAAHYSFSKGTSTQDYPNSLMGVIALLRQNFLDAQWYKSKPATEGLNLSLQAFIDNQALPQIMEAGDLWNDLRADKAGDEFGVQYLIKGGGNEYQRIAEIKSTNAAFILPLNFPLAMDIKDPLDARYINLASLKHWEMAPSNPGVFEKAQVSFSLTTSGLKETGDFLPNLRKAVENGLSEQRALEALTKTPATLLGVYQQVGSLEPGKLANFLVLSGPLFDEKTIINENWVQGKKYPVKETAPVDLAGSYRLTAGANSYTLEVKDAGAKPTAQLTVPDTLKADLSITGKFVQIGFNIPGDSSSKARLTGIIGDSSWSGTGKFLNDQWISWSAEKITPAKAADSVKKKRKQNSGIQAELTFPFTSYGNTVQPKQQDMLIRNATIWTNEKEGKLLNADLLIKNGKIAAVGKNLNPGTAQVIDGTGKHVTAGIIDEHSHIALTGGVNECTQSVTAEVRVADVIDPEDIDIYRDLSGGVTSSHILHGSCNTIGGQTQLLKLKWGANAENLKFPNWDPFIKFALGENVKNSRSPSSSRFPDSRMGVEEVLTDAFTRAKAYQLAGAAKRKDLELEALVEILNRKRFITCHSYVQSEINMMMKVAEKFGFTVNTFTHILEGYKVADKMKKHGAAASTFSDWWSYKMEVSDAVPQNAWLLQQQGVNVAINSDDAEMSTRLNQEAAKSIKYAGMGEEDALKMVTLNPAIMLHVADRTGSIKVGKDADVVIWSGSPLSVYSKAEKTIVDGTVYFDREKDLAMRNAIAEEKERLVQKMTSAKSGGEKTTPALPSFRERNHCEEDSGDDNNVWQRAQLQLIH